MLLFSDFILDPRSVKPDKRFNLKADEKPNFHHLACFAKIFARHLGNLASDVKENWTIVCKFNFKFKFLFRYTCQVDLTG